mgnify:CR=1 FL=1
MGQPFAFRQRHVGKDCLKGGVLGAAGIDTETDLSAFDKEKYSKLIEVLCSSGESLSGHITNDTERSPETGLLYFSDSTKERIRKYFG